MQQCKFGRVLKAKNAGDKKTDAKKISSKVDEEAVLFLFLWRRLGRTLLKWESDKSRHENKEKNKIGRMGRVA